MDKQQRAAMNGLIRQAMPAVVGLVASLRAKHGDAYVVECQRRGMAGEPGWFFARQGPLAVGTPWDHSLIRDYGMGKLGSDQAIAVIKEPPGISSAPAETNPGGGHAA